MNVQTIQQQKLYIFGLKCLSLLILSFSSLAFGDQIPQEQPQSKQVNKSIQPVKETSKSSIDKETEKLKAPIKTNKDMGEGQIQPSLKQMPKKLKGSTSPSNPAGRGFTLALYTGLSSCIPSGKADCSNQYPGGILGGSLGYRWTYVRWSIESDRSRLWISDATLSDTELASQTILMSLYGYYPYKKWDFFLGGGLGYGQVSLVDQPTQYGVSWSSLWQNTRLSFGAQRPLNSRFALEVRFILDLHLGGEYCSMINGIEKCIDPNDKFIGQSIDISHIAHLSVGVRY